MTDQQNDVISKRVTLTNKRGLHARASAKFINTVSMYDAAITVVSHNDMAAETAQADSIMDLLMLACACGSEITIEAKGVEAGPAVEALVDLVNNRFGEGE